MNSLVYEAKPRLDGAVLQLHSKMALKDSGKENKIY